MKFVQKMYSLFVWYIFKTVQQNGLFLTVFFFKYTNVSQQAKTFHDIHYIQIIKRVVCYWLHNIVTCIEFKVLVNFI
jgi:hypothetical protein